MLFEKEPEHPAPDASGQIDYGQAKDTALLIPCYKSEKLIAATLEAALKVFPPQNIFVSIQFTFQWKASVFDPSD